MLYQQAPAGDRIQLSSSVFDPVSLEQYFRPYHINFYNSGTSALAALITAAIKINNISNPEIIIPAYGCPDLVSAILYARAKPVFIDLIPNRPWMDLNQLSQRITSKTVSIIAVNFLGIPEQLKQLRSIAQEHNLFLIEDNAQTFPVNNTPSSFTGEQAILSFGRGKPVNLLTGGAVLYRDANIKTALSGIERNSDHLLPERLTYDLQVKLFNMLVSPYIYGIIAVLPFLHLGETRYKKLNRIKEINNRAIECLYGNISRYLLRETKIQDKYTQLLSNFDKNKLINLPVICCNGKLPRLLRYPILVTDQNLRDEIYQELKHAGIGVSLMYPGIIPEICGFKYMIKTKIEYCNAIEFSKKILTLPTHARVTEKDINKIHTILSNLI